MQNVRASKFEVMYQRFIVMVYKNVVGPHISVDYVVLMQII